jgi:hypothetical protein
MGCAHSVERNPPSPNPPLRKWNAEEMAAGLRALETSYASAKDAPLMDAKPCARVAQASESLLQPSKAFIVATPLVLLTQSARLTRSPADPPRPLSDAVFKRLITEWNFDIFTIPYTELPAIVFHVLLSHPAISDAASGLDLAKLWRYVGEIAARYHLRPFHNFRHAVDGELP